MKNTAILTVATMALITVSGRGETESKRAQRQAITIQADTLSYDEETGLTTVEGNVAITRDDGKTTLRADRAILKTGDTPGTLRSLVAGTLTATSRAQADLQKKLENTVIKQLDFRDAALRDVADFLARVSGQKLNILVEAADATASPTVTLALENVPLYDVLRYVCEVTNSELRIDDHAVVIIAGKGTPPNTYGVKLKVTPVAGAENQFMVEFRISEVQPNGKESILSAPRVTVLGGMEGMMKVADEGERNGVICTATVTPKEKDLLVDTSVTIKEDGKVLWSCSQETTVAK